MASWKAAQSKSKKSKQVKLALSAIAFIIGLIFLSQIVKFTHTLLSPWTKTTAVRQYSWKGDSTLNIILKDKTISLFSYNPTDQKITVINIPDNTYLDAGKGLGKWQLSSIFGLGGDQLLKSSIASLFGIPVEALIDPVTLGDLSSKNPFSAITILPKIKTDLTPIEFIRLKMGISFVRFDKIKQIDLEDLGFLDKSNLADGTQILIADPFKLDTLSEGLADPTIKSERKTIAIFNSTNHPGIAQRAARVFSNIGGDVIIISNGKKRYEKTVVIGEKSKTLERLKQILEPSGTIDPKDEDLASSRAQINVFLGEDYFKTL